MELAKLVHHYSTTRTLWSSQQSLVSATRASSIFYDHISFSYAASFLWNNLLLHIRQANSLQCFKSLLKTHLFKAALCNLLICILYLSLIVYFIVLFMRLEDFCMRRFTNVLLLFYYFIKKCITMKKLQHTIFR